VHNKGVEIPLLTWSEAVSFFILEGDRAMDSFQNKINTFCEVKDGDFAIEMPDDTMLNPAGTPSIPAGATVILRPDDDFKNGSIVAVIVSDPLSNAPSMTIKKLVIDGQNIYLTPLNPRYSPSLLADDHKIVAVAKGVQFNL
jgi:SOS-response transcriptional repressor LexA